MVERLLSKPEVRGAIPRISEVKDIEQLINFLQKTTFIEVLYKKHLPRGILTSCLPTETKASSTVCNHGDVAQMVERSRSRQEVRGSMLRISKTSATHQMVITISRFSIAYWKS